MAKLHFRDNMKPICGTKGKTTSRTWKVTCERCKKTWRYNHIKQKQDALYAAQQSEAAKKVAALGNLRTTAEPAKPEWEPVKDAVERLISEANQIPHFAA